MRYLRSIFLTCLCAGLVGVGPAFAGEGPGAFLGVDLGVSEPGNGNFRAHARTGAMASPYLGYMLTDNLGLQGQLYIGYQEPDNDLRGIPNENQATSLFGWGIGPRLSIPARDVNFLGLVGLEPYLVAQGGTYSGLSGRLSQTSPGFSVGGGMDFYLTENVAVSLFGRFNRAYQSPRPYVLLGRVPQSPGEQGPADIRWATGGIGLKYDFRVAAAPPPPPPPPVVQAPPPPPPPVRRKIVLRSVHFDFDKSAIRADAKPVLDEAVQTLKDEGKISVVVAGHTDSMGSDQYNVKLSQRRAAAVREYLVRAGISAARIRTEAFGESQPVASNETDDGRAQNRRVELNVD